MTRRVRFSNNATSKLAANLSAVELTCTITSGDGARFPALTAGQWFMATLVRASDNAREIVRVTARTSDTLTIVRAAEPINGSQVALPFVAGDKFELRLTAGMLGDELDRIDLGAFTRVVNASANTAIAAADVNTLFRVNTSGGARTITLPEISTLPDDFDVIVAKVTPDANAVTITRSGAADTINGATTYALPLQWACAWLIADRSTNTWTAINSGPVDTGPEVGQWVVDAFTGNGTPGPFTLSGTPPSKNATLLVVGGVLQAKSTYTLSGNQITAGGNVAAGVSVEVSWTGALPIGTPGDGTVTTAKIVDDAVTFAKMQNIATATILGRSAAGTGDVEALTGAQATNIITGAVGQLAGFRNLLINGNFQINQRGYVSGTNVGAPNTYTLDRWRVVTSGQNVTFSASGNGNQITAPAGGIEQVIEGVNIGGGTYVLNWTGTATATVNGTARAKGESFTLPANTNATVRLIGGTASQVQLEPGTVATPFEHRPYGAELALCQRYYYRVTLSANSQVFCQAYADNATTGRGYVQFPVPLRIAPTALEQTGVAGNYVVSTASATVTATSVPVFAVANTAVGVVNVPTSGLTAGQGGDIRGSAGSGAGAFLGFSAEL